MEDVWALSMKFFNLTFEILLKTFRWGQIEFIAHLNSQAKVVIFN